jgi:hypothetical protein
MAIGIGIGLPFGKKATPNPVAQAPVNTSPPVISPEGNQVIGTLFTANSGSWFATRPLTFEYRWTRNGTPISGATSQTYTSVTADEGQTLRCEVRATNAFGVSSYIASSNSSTGVSLPVNTVAPVISGSTTLGSVLTTTDGTWTGTSPITFSYQWKRGGVSIGGATSSTYTLVAADSSANITCEVTGTNVAGSVAANSNTITAQNFNPVNTIAPTLSPSGTQSTGTIITLGNGTWTGASPITFEYRWLRDNIVISGQTSNTYTLVAGDDGKVIKGQVRAINSVSTSAYVTSSNQVDAVNVAPFVATGGTVTEVGGFKIHTFTSSGDFEVESGSTNSLKFLIVAGGGSGGNFLAGGGGAGGLIYMTSQSINTGVYPVVIGAGGAAVAPALPKINGNNGSNSSFNSQTAIGGGGGGADQNANNGGSGGGTTNGAAGTGTSGQGYAGSTNGAGGGAGEAGGTDGSGHGGDGLEIDISGTNTYYAGGGAEAFNVNGGLGGGGRGADSGGGATLRNGTNGLGGGGGGAYFGATPGTGGSGVVIIAYPL